MARRRCGYMSVDVDLSEAIEHITDEVLLEEVEERKLTKAKGYDFEPIAEMRDAYEELLRGRPAEALAILDRLLNPKWNSIRACETDLKRAKLPLTN